MASLNLWSSFENFPISNFTIERIQKWVANLKLQHRSLFDFDKLRRDLKSCNNLTKKFLASFILLKEKKKSTRSAGCQLWKSCQIGKMLNPMQVCIGSLESKTQLVSVDFFSNSGPGPGPSNRIRNAAAIGLDFHLHFVQTYYQAYILCTTIICLFRIVGL